MKATNTKWLRVVMLAAGFILLFTVTIPHHHHEGGAACIFLNCNNDGEDEEHSCDCAGHTLAINVQQIVVQETIDPLHILKPLYTLFDLTYDPQIILPFTVSGSNRPIYTESLHDVWIPASTGLRAPPIC
jgi:hypothetical protein